MPTNNFKLFDQNKANLLSDTEYANATQRLNGVQTGVASSQLQNKFAYQVSLVAYAIAQIMNQNGLDASDTLAVSAFVGNLGGSLLQKVADKATTTEAAAGVLTNKYISPATMKAAALLLSGGVMSGTLNMNNNKITNLPSPSTPSEPATKEYVDGNAGHKVLSESINLSFSNVSEGKKKLTKTINFSEVDAIGVRLTFNSDFSVIKTDGYSSSRILLGQLTLFSASLHAGTLIKRNTTVFVLFTFYPGEYDGNMQYMVASPNCVFPGGSGDSAYVTKIRKFSLDTSDYFVAGVTDIAGPKCSGNITADIYKVYF